MGKYTGNHLKENDIGAPIVNLDIKNPDRKNELEYKAPSILVDSLLKREGQIIELMNSIKKEIVS